MKFTVSERTIITCVLCQGQTVVSPENKAIYNTDDLTCNCMGDIEDIEQHVPPNTEDESVCLSDKTNEQLRMILKDLNIPFGSKLNKSELIELI